MFAIHPDCVGKSRATVSSAKSGPDPQKAQAALGSRERGIVLACIGGLCGVAWGELLLYAVEARDAGDVAGPIGGFIILSGPNFVEPTSVVPPSLANMVVLTIAAVFAVVLPPSTVLMLNVAALCKQRWPFEDVLPRTLAFFAAYMAAWAAFGVALGVIAWEMAQLRPEFAARSTLGPILGGCVLLFAGLYQFTPIKQKALAICQAPGKELAAWRGTRWVDTVRAGLAHWRRSATSDWAFALLLPVGGLGNPLWALSVAFFITTEKLVSPEGDFGRWAGLMISLIGMAVLFGATF